jgi:5-methylcytosine-specific restriction protein A
MQRDCGMCQQCKREARARVGTQVDHVVPVFEGGSDDDANLEVICDEHHQAKNERERQRRAGLI